MNKYKIYVNRDATKITVILTTLFSMGYVFSRSKRLRMIKPMLCERGYIFETWLWLIIGSDKDCKMVLERRTGYNDYDIEDYKTITFEEFLKLPDE